MVICLERGSNDFAVMHMVQLMPLPPRRSFCLPTVNAKVHHTRNTTILCPLYRTACVSWRPQL